MAEIRTPAERRLSKNRRAQIRRALRNRDENKDSKELIEALRQKYIRLMVDPRYRLLDQETFHKRFRRTFGCPQRLLDRWSTCKHTQSRVREFLREVYGGGERIKELYDLLWERAREGSVAAIKLGFELTGEYTPGLRIKDERTVEDLLDSLEKEEGTVSEEAAMRKELTQSTMKSATRH